MAEENKSVADKAAEIKEEVSAKVEATVEDAKAKLEEVTEKSAEKAEELKAAAEEVAEKVEDAVEEIVEKVEQKVEELKEDASAAAEKIEEIVKEEVAKAEVKSEEVKEKVAEKVEEAKEKVEEVKEKVADKVEEVKEKVAKKANEVVEKARKATKVDVDKVAETAEETVEEVAPYNDEPVDYTKVEPLPDFDWDAMGKTDEVYPEKIAAEYAKAYEETLTSIADHEVVDGTIVALTKKEAVVDINYKSEGIVQLSEFRYNPDLKVGDKVKVYVESLEDKSGQLVLSHKKARMLNAWDNVNEALETDAIIQGFVKCRTKGGLIVDVFGLEAFLPGSQIDVKPIRDYDVYVGKNMEFKVVKINNEFKNVVVSHKALIEAELEKQKAVIMSKLEKGQVLEGTVKNITSYGVFIDLGGVDGLIHITDLSWGRVSHPEEIVELDQKINVVILDFDDDKKRIALGLKQLQPHPWESLDENLKVGDKLKGKVVVLANFGVFVELEEGIDGLIHISDLSWQKKISHPSEFCKVGDDMEIVVLEIDKDNRRLSLGHKQLEQNPWEVFETVFTEGSVHKGTVNGKNDKGFIVTMPYGIEGFCPARHGKKENGEKLAIDDNLDFEVLEFNKDARKIIVSHARTYEKDAKDRDVKEKRAKATKSRAASKAVQSVNQKVEKSTLGDLDALSQLKKDMEDSEKAE